MSMAFTVGGFTRSFSVRLLGFDRQQVIGFCSHIANDYERTVRELEQSRVALHALQAAQSAPAAAMPLQASAQGVARILSSAQRIANEIEHDAKTQTAQLLAEAKARAADLVEEAERAAARIVDEAKHTAAGIVDAARREEATCAEQVAGLRNHYAGLRAAFERAADTAASALSDIAEHQLETPDPSESRRRVGSPLESSALSTT
jgi:cell division septum initiation protein DivIVA